MHRSRVRAFWPMVSPRPRRADLQRDFPGILPWTIEDRNSELLRRNARTRERENARTRERANARTRERLERANARTRERANAQTWQELNFGTWSAGTEARSSS